MVDPVKKERSILQWPKPGAFSMACGTPCLWLEAWSLRFSRLPEGNESLPFACAPAHGSEVITCGDDLNPGTEVPGFYLGRVI